MKTTTHKVEKYFDTLKLGDKFFHDRQLCIKTGLESYHVWSSGVKRYASPHLVVRPVKARVRINFCYTNRKGNP